MSTRGPDLALVWAQGRTGVIGNGGGIPWYLPEDLKHFQALTHGHPVIMGRKTWDSLPARSRPLTGRANIVVTRQEDWDADGAYRADSVEAAICMADGLRQRGGPAFIIGGGQLYKAAEPVADRVHVTTVDVDAAGDTRAPLLGDGWRMHEQGEWLTSRSGLRYRIDVFAR